MKKVLITMTALLMTGGLAGCTSASPAPGHYENESKSVDANGTEHKEKDTTNVWYDANGVKHETTDAKTTTDPKGLFNKTTTETQTDSTQ